MRARHLLRITAAAALAAAVAAPAAQAQKGKDKVHTGTLDDGRLEVSWFSEGGLAFRDVEEADYLWVKDGFDIDGHTFHFKEWAVTFLGDDEHDRDASDRRLAKSMAEAMPDMLEEYLGDEWEGKASTSRGSGDVVVEGRVVDCSTGNTAARIVVGWGAGSAHCTVELKFTDASSGELLAAVHNRSSAGMSWDDTETVLADWISDFGNDVAKHGLSSYYATGEKVDD
jgi:hypothetical protein